MDVAQRSAALKRRTSRANNLHVPAAPSTTMRPLLKWAGGKRQLLPALRRHYPASFDRYVEPFAGSGAVFFDLFGAGRLEGRRARLVDVNPDLIGCYRAVRDETAAVIAALGALEQEHRARGSDITTSATGASIRLVSGGAPAAHACAVAYQRGSRAVDPPGQPPTHRNSRRCSSISIAQGSTGCSG